MYHIDQRLEVIRGDFKGKIVRVSQLYDDQVVLQVKDSGDKWVDFCRASETEVASLTRNATQYELFYRYHDPAHNCHGGPFSSIDEARCVARAKLDGESHMATVEIRNRSSNIPFQGPYGDTVEVVRRTMRLDCGLQLKNLRRNKDQDVVLAAVEILGTRCHAIFIKVASQVEPGEHGGYEVQFATNDPENYYGDIENLAGTSGFETIRLPGYDGDWVMVIYPFAS